MLSVDCAIVHHVKVVLRSNKSDVYIRNGPLQGSLKKAIHLSKSGRNKER
jgi:hypothetical protein